MREDAVQQSLFAEQTGEEKLTGLVDSIIFASDNGQFCVFRLQPEGRNSRTTVTINGQAPLVGQQLQLRGNWVTHPRFGLQFKATGMVMESPTNVAGIERFLGSGHIAGLGPVRAHRIVQKFGDDTLRIIEEQPHRLTEVEGISKKTADKIVASYNEQSELREVMLWLESHGISGTLAGAIYERYSSFALEVLEHHPYQLAQEVQGIGFNTADTIAASLGIGKDDDSRIAAGIGYALQQIAMDGHCCIPESPLADKAAKLLGVARGEVLDVMHTELAAGHLLVEDVRPEPLIYPPYLYQAEQQVAARLREIQQEAEPLMVEGPERKVDRWADKAGIALSAGQREALVAVLQNGVFVLTGGPGTGKTTVVRGMIDLLKAQGLSILLGAPTGRAAKRMAEATGRKAMTVHRLLEAQGGAGGSMFARDEDDPLDADVVILDEVSMMDIVLMQHFLAAVPQGCHIILVGAVDQLPSVGPGSVLQDILHSGVIPSVCLTEIFRQGEGSEIVLAAHAINAGREPQCSEAGDFRFLALPDAEAAAQRIVQLCTRELPAQGFHPLTDVQVLSPMHAQVCGVDNLNKLLQAALNPPSPAKAEFSNSSRAFRLGDKVLQTKNNYQKQVFNGDVGLIKAVEPDHITVQFGELDVDYEKSELLELTLAYAMSVHKSQGSEYPVVLLPLVPGHRIMLQRNLLYTAVTRAKKLVILLGSRRALNTAVDNDRTRKRYTLLAERLHGDLGEH